MGISPKPDPIKHCATCGVLMTRKRFGKRLEDPAVFLRRRHCGKACGATKEEVKPGTHHWRARRHRKPTCEKCGTAEDLHVHHKDRDRTNNDPSNLETLCSTHHLKWHWHSDPLFQPAGVPRGGTTPPLSTDTSSL